MTRAFKPQELMDSTVVDREGRKIGKVGTVYLADDTKNPEWVTVKTGLFGQKESFVPLSGAAMNSGDVQVSVAKDQVSEAPHFDAEEHLSQQESAQLYQHYGLPSPRRSGEGNAPRGQGQRPGQEMGTAAMGTGIAGQQQQAPRPGANMRPGQQANGQQDQQSRRPQHAKADADGDHTMIRSEERLRVNTQEEEAGHVRLRKYVVTEEQQVTVPVSHEEVRLEREPIAEGEAGRNIQIGEDEQEITLHREKPVVQKETVPVEKVRLGTERVTEQQTVRDEVRSEQFDIQNDNDADADNKRRR